MDYESANRVALRETGVQAVKVRSVPGGFGHWVFRIDERWILRVAKSEDAACRDHMEARLLPRLATEIGLPVPKFSWSGDLDGFSYLGYKILPGRALRIADVETGLCSTADLASVVRDIHRFDVTAARDILDIAGTTDDWQRRYRELRSETFAKLAGIVSAAMLQKIGNEFSVLFEAGFVFDPVFVHGDLGTEHLLIDPVSGQITGIIDWEGANVGDPAVDFVGFIITLGPSRCDEIIVQYASSVDSGFRNRVRAYWWIGAVYAVLHGMKTGDRDLTTDALHNLEGRLTALQNSR